MFEIPVDGGVFDQLGRRGRSTGTAISAEPPGRVVDADGHAAHERVRPVRASRPTSDLDELLAALAGTKLDGGEATFIVAEVHADHCTDGIDTEGSIGRV